MTQQEILKTLGLRIRKIRLSKDITQSQLADMCRFQKSTMSKIEAGQVNVSYITLLKLSNGLNMTICELISPDHS
jgi:transcriptional regulator with XRE-family HTH domain